MLLAVPPERSGSDLLTTRTGNLSNVPIALLAGAVRLHQVNGYLIGKEYGYLVGLRISSDSSQTGTKFLKEGILASLVWMVPLVNFIAPVLLAGSILHSRFLNTKGKE